MSRSVRPRKIPEEFLSHVPVYLANQDPKKAAERAGEIAAWDNLRAQELARRCYEEPGALARAWERYAKSKQRQWEAAQKHGQLQLTVLNGEG